MKALSTRQRLKTEWADRSYYQRFESLVAFVLTLVIGLIILVALYRLTASVIAGLLFGVLDPLDPGAFQALFGEIMNLLDRDNVRFNPPGINTATGRVSGLFESMIPIVPSAGILIEF